MSKVITVFGSSQPLPGDEEYETAHKLGKILGGAGFDVCTGGYQGIMDAVSKGAVEEGKDAIGITVNSFSAKESENLTKEIKCDSLFQRIEKLIAIGDGFIILRGGTGTLVEFSMVWELVNKNLLIDKPIACHGKMWKGLIDTMDRRMKFEGRRHNFIFHSTNVEECAEFIINKFD